MSASNQTLPVLICIPLSNKWRISWPLVVIDTIPFVAEFEMLRRLVFPLVVIQPFCPTVVLSLVPVELTITPSVYVGLLKSVEKMVTSAWADDTAVKVKRPTARARVVDFRDVGFIGLGGFRQCGSDGQGVWFF